jgi:hypothetical protein
MKAADHIKICGKHITIIPILQSTQNYYALWLKMDNSCFLQGNLLGVHYLFVTGECLTEEEAVVLTSSSDDPPPPSSSDDQTHSPVTVL